MTDNVSNLILEQLQLIRRAVEGLPGEVADRKVPMSGLAMQVSRLQSQFAHFGAQVAIRSGRFDRVEGRLERIERRLDMQPA